MADYSLYNTRINQYGYNKRDRVINKEKEYLYRKLSDHPSAQIVSIGDLERLLVVVSTENAYVKKIISLPEETFEAGQLVEYKSENWLITESDLDDQIQTKGKMTLCPNTLKFQNSSGVILSYPYFVDTTYPSLSENKTIVTSDTTRKIVLSLDDETKQFFIDKRFMGDVFNNTPQVWKIIDLDSSSKRGLLIVTLEKDEYDAGKDNLEFGVCNYFIPSVPPSVIDTKISYLGLPEIRIGGSTKTFEAKFLDENAVAVWDVVLPAGYENQFVITPNGNLLGIKAEDNIALEDKIVTINLSSEDGTYSTSLNIKVVNAI